MLLRETDKQVEYLASWILIRKKVKQGRGVESGGLVLVSPWWEEGYDTFRWGGEEEDSEKVT